MKNKTKTFLGTDVVRASDTEITLNDLQSAVSAAAKADGRFNRKADGTAVSSDYCPWTTDILRDDPGDEWAAVIQAGDGQYYRVPFTVDESGAVSLGPEASRVARRTAYVDAKYCYNGAEVRAAGTSDGAAKGWESRRGGVAMDKSDEANEASRKAIGSGTREDHEAAADAHTEAMRTNMRMAEKAMNSDDKTAESKFRTAAAEHGKAAWMHNEHAKNSGDSKAKGTDELAENILSCRDSGVEISAAKAKEWRFGVPVDFQWMPGGVTNVHCGTVISGQERTADLWVECDEATAGTVQKSFSAWCKQSPRRLPFGCVEHHEEEKAFEPVVFKWGATPEPGVYCTAKPTKLGADNVTGRLHTSFSPSFGTDADYRHASCEDCDKSIVGKDACKCGGTVVFPDGIRGSESNPARVVAVSPKSVGSLTNWPAFKNILPVTAKDRTGKARTNAAGRGEWLDGMVLVRAGDVEGHDFHGNQWTKEGYEMAKADAVEKTKTAIDKDTKEAHAAAWSAHNTAREGAYKVGSHEDINRHTNAVNFHNSEYRRDETGYNKEVSALHAQTSATDADRLAKEADKKTATAAKTGSPSGHTNAGKAHEMAAQRRREAASYYSQAGDMDKYREHDALARTHEYAANDHYEKASKAKATPNKASDTENILRRYTGEAGAAITRAVETGTPETSADVLARLGRGQTATRN